MIKCRVEQGATGCLEYRIENNTESSVSISYYTCDGAPVSDNLGSGNQITFCADTAYGVIETGGATLINLGECPAPTYGLYTADEYYCVDNECVFSLSDVVVAFELPFTPNYSKYYELQAGGFYYILSEEVFTGPGAICNKTPNYTDCATWCFV